MAYLPIVRVTQALPFVDTGCDYAGSILLRNAWMHERMFVSKVTSVIHLELSADLTTKNFLAALRRFISLRSKRSKIYSDNGTNFIGAMRGLDEMHHKNISLSSHPTWRMMQFHSSASSSLKRETQGFWKKWHQQYLTTLHQRPKWVMGT